MIWSPFVLVVGAAAAAKPKERTATPGLVLASFGDGPKYEATLTYFRRNAAHLGFTSTLLWGLKDVERDPFFRANLTHLGRMGTRRPLCAGFKALMLQRALESAGEGGYVFWADASRYFDYASRPVKKGIARRAVEALDGGDALGFVAGCGAKKARAAPTLAHVFVEAPSLKALFPGVDAARAPEINSAHMILRNTRRNRELAEAFFGGPRIPKYRARRVPGRRAPGPGALEPPGRGAGPRPPQHLQLRADAQGLQGQERRAGQVPQELPRRRRAARRRQIRGGGRVHGRLKFIR